MRLPTRPRFAQMYILAISLSVIGACSMLPFAAAEQSFRDDLAIHPASGWALHGSEKAFAAQGKQAEAQSAQRDLANSRALADSKLRTTQ